MTKKLAVVAAILLSTGAFAACGGLDTDDLNDEVASTYAGGFGVSEDDVSVDCPDTNDPKEGDVINCPATVPDQGDVDIEVTFGEVTDDTYNFEITNVQKG